MARFRLGARLRQQDWVAFAIDLCIVVVGVFLGIQASNWNDERRDRAAGRAYLERIRDDLEADVRELNQRELYWRDEADAGARALHFAVNGGVADWSILNDFYAAGQTWHYSPIDATYSELMSAGRLNLIPDISLRKKLAEYYVGQRDRTAFLGTGEPDYRRDIREVVPFDLQQYLVTRCQPGNGLFATGGRCPPPSAGTDVAALNRRIARDDKLMGELRFWMTDLHYMRLNGHERRAEAIAILQDIKRSMR